MRTFRAYPAPFWLMTVVNFVDQLGASLLVPFFALYVTKRFGISMAEVGVLFAVYGIASFAGAFPGGALTDRFGRKGIIIFGLLTSSLTRLAMGLAGTYGLFIVIAFVAGMFTDVSRPVYDSVFMDLLSEEKRAGGFGIRRAATNLAMVLGPAIGGFVAGRSYMALFVASAIACTLAATLVFRAIPETKPGQPEDQEQESALGSFGGYVRVLRDARFMAFVGACLLSWIIYVNMSTTLGVYLRNRYAVPESFYGSLLSLNAAMVVFFQFPVSQWTGKRPLLLMMALGTILFAVGLGMYAIVSTYLLFALAMAILTTGELVALPVSTTLVAAFAPEDMRGRYNFIFYDSWVIAYALGPYLAGLVLDGPNPDLLWFACGQLGMIAALVFVLLHWWDDPRTASAPSEP